MNPSRDDSRRRRGAAHKPPVPPELRREDVREESLFREGGPVTLGSVRKGTTMLGGVQPSKPYATERESQSPESEKEPGEETIREYTEPIATYSEPVASKPDESRRIVFKTFAETPSPATSWSPKRWRPRIDSTAFVHPLGVIIGNVRVEPIVFVGAGAVIRGDNEEPIHIGTDSSIQECAVLKDLPTRSEGKIIEQRIVDVDNMKYSVYIADKVTVCAQAQVYGPAYIGSNVFIGMQSLVFWARIESGVVIEPGCLVMNVTVPTGVFVPAGMKLTSQKAVKDLPPLTSRYRFHGINEEMVATNREILRGLR